MLTVSALHDVSIPGVLPRYVFSTCYYIGPLFDFIDANASAVPAFLETFQYDTQLSASVDPFVTNILLQAFDQCRTNLSTRVAACLDLAAAAGCLSLEEPACAASTPGCAGPWLPS